MFAFSFLISLGFTCKMGLTFTAGLGVAPLPGAENRVLVADTEEGVLKLAGVAEDAGVEEEARMLVRNTGRGAGELEGGRVLLAPCFLIVSVSAAAKLSAVVWREGESRVELDHEDLDVDSVPELDDAETESLLGDRDLES